MPAGVARLGRLVGRTAFAATGVAAVAFKLPAGSAHGASGYESLYRGARALTHDELPWVGVKRPTLHYPILK